jgi:predicted phage terminase large subunit-like protein
MNTTARQLFRATLRHDFAPFIHRCFVTVDPGTTYLDNWHIAAIAHQLERIRRGEIHRLIINIPPRNMKSISASVAFPAFVLGHDPTRRILCASYSQELSAKHSRDCRAVMESAWYKKVFPLARLNPNKSSVTEFETTARGYRLATSVGGSVTGRGGNLMIIDDPLKPEDAHSEVKRTGTNTWYDSTLSSRLDQKSEDAIVIVAQRLHCDDLVGHLLDRDPSWTVLNLPAIAVVAEYIDLGHGVFHRREIGDLLHPEREPQSVLEEIKLQQGSLTFSAQYQQAPVPVGGALVQREWLHTYTEAPARQEGDRVIQSWDTASKAGPKNDYSVCTTWLVRKKRYYLLDVLRVRRDFPALKKLIVSHAQAFRVRSVLIEDAGSGIGLIQELKHDGKIHPVKIAAERDKLSRLEACTAPMEAGQVFIPESAPWLADYLNEILAFPNGKYDDQVDSTSQFLTWERDRPRIHVG